MEAVAAAASDRRLTLKWSPHRNKEEESRARTTKKNKEEETKENPKRFDKIGQILRKFADIYHIK